MFRLRIAGGAVVLGLALMGFQKVDHSLNYVPIAANITRVESTCYLERAPRGMFALATRTTGAMPCSKAEALRAGEPAYRGMLVAGTIHTAFDYVSPVDNAGHSARLAYAYEDYDHLARLKAGDRLAVLAHRTKVGPVAQDYENLGAFATIGDQGL